MEVVDDGETSEDFSSKYKTLDDVLIEVSKCRNKKYAISFKIKTEDGFRYNTVGYFETLAGVVSFLEERKTILNKKEALQ